jgi:hypothetical protein
VVVILDGFLIDKEKKKTKNKKQTNTICRLSYKENSYKAAIPIKYFSNDI